MNRRDEDEEDRLADLHEFEKDQLPRFINCLSREIDIPEDDIFGLIHFAALDGFFEWTGFQDQESGQIEWYREGVIFWPGWTPIELAQYIAENCTSIYLNRKGRFGKIWPRASNWMAEMLYFNLPDHRPKKRKG